MVTDAFKEFLSLVASPSGYLNDQFERKLAPVTEKIEDAKLLWDVKADALDRLSDVRAEVERTPMPSFTEPRVADSSLMYFLASRNRSVTRIAGIRRTRE